MTLKGAANKNISKLAIENWINDTLSQAEYYQIPGVIKRINVGEGPGAKGKQNVTIDYGIDRLTLNYTGFSNEIVDKLYRSLYVNSVGFYNQIEDLANQFSDIIKLKKGIKTQLKEKSPSEQIERSDEKKGMGAESQKHHQTK